MEKKPQSARPAPVEFMYDHDTVIVYGGDHNLDPWEAELRAKNECLAIAAITKVREAGECRPVMVVARTDAFNLGEPTAAGPSTGLLSWVVTRRQVLAAVKGSVRRFLRDQFQRARWPKSFYTVALRYGVLVECCESRLFADCPADVLARLQ